MLVGNTKEQRALHQYDSATTVLIATHNTAKYAGHPRYCAVRKTKY